MDRRLSALKVWLLFSVMLSAAGNDSCSPECRWVSCSEGQLQLRPVRSWKEPDSRWSWFKTRNVKHPCLTCDHGSKEPGPLLDASCFRHPKWVGVRGVPIGVLSAAKLPIPDPTQLAFLALVDTEITDMEQNTLANLSKLQELRLEFNNLTKVKTSYFTAGGLGHLRTLSLAHNQIAHLETGCFQDLTGLWELVLWGNQLTYIDHSSFVGLRELRELVLGFNRIETIHGGTFESFNQHTLRLVDISRNRLVQACLSPELFNGFDNIELMSLLTIKLSSQTYGRDNEYLLEWNEKKSKDDILGANDLCSAPALDGSATLPKSAMLVSPFVIVLAKAVVALQDMRIFDRLHTCTHLQRQYSVPNYLANKNRRGAHDTSFDAPHYWEIPDSLVDSTQEPAPGKLDAPHYWEIPDALVTSTRQPTTDEPGAARYWEIPDCVVDSVPDSDEAGTPWKMPDALVKSTRDPTTDEARYCESQDADTRRGHHRPSSLPIDTFLCTRTVPTNKAPRPASLPHQYWNITDEDIGGDSVTFYASAAETRFSAVVAKSEENNRLYETETTQAGDEHAIPPTYGTDSAQTASVLDPED
ncbi:hypothetical protein Bbelb_089100 [Branchiostoma belcheri]|nr:hypothetical protein Bbelb_089100 [Branchiostoma belcheri]